MNAKTHTIALPVILDITAAPALLGPCKDALDERNTVTIDASAVERITTPAFQVLISLIHTRKIQQLRTQITAASPSFANAAAALGLSDYFKEGTQHG